MPDLRVCTKISGGFSQLIFVLLVQILRPGFRQLNHQQMLANRRNAVFFCQILCIFMLHVLYVCGIMVLR